MERLTPQQRLQIVKIFYQNQESIRSTHRALRAMFGRHNRPSELMIRRIVERFEASYTLHPQRPPIRRRSARSAENIAAVRASADESSSTSVRRRAQQLGLSTMSTWRILRKDLGRHPYKLVLTQELKPAGHRLCREFADWALEQIEADEDFSKKIIFSDEAHFCLNGYVNKQNMRYWEENNPRQVLEKQLYPQKVTVWCGLWAGGIIGPYFFENDNGERVTVNGERYRFMLMDFLWPQLDDLDLDAMWFQQDGATCHTAAETIDLLRTRFGHRIISRHTPRNWPPRSCDLTPLDFFLWGYLKSLVFANNPTTIEQLKENITREIQAIQPDMLARVMRNWTHRIRVCRASRGGHLNDVLFKT